jgi:hypothetical protein
MQTNQSWLSLLFALRQESRAVGVPYAFNKLTVENVESDIVRMLYFKVGRCFTGNFYGSGLYYRFRLDLARILSECWRVTGT